MIEQLFIVGALLSGLIVITAKNPMHSVLALVVAFTNVSALILASPLLSVEFLALLFIIVYVGAIAILFLFVIMMLNIKLVEIKDNATRYVPMGFVIGLIFLFEIYLILSEGMSSPSVDSIPSYIDWANWYQSSPNIIQIAQFLYTEGYIWFIVASLILLVAMIAAILLTLQHEDLDHVKRQDLFVQISREPKTSIKMFS